MNHRIRLFGRHDLVPAGAGALPTGRGPTVRARGHSVLLLRPLAPAWSPASTPGTISLRYGGPPPAAAGRGPRRACWPGWPGSAGLASRGERPVGARLAGPWAGRAGPATGAGVLAANRAWAAPPAPGPGSRPRPARSCWRQCTCPGAPVS